jgi:hypothetical protein
MDVQDEASQEDAFRRRESFDTFQTLRYKSLETPLNPRCQLTFLLPTTTKITASFCV